MNKKSLVSVALLATFSFTNHAFAQNPNIQPIQQHQNNMPAQHQVMPRPSFSDFPTPEELARMTPPEPITEEKIKKRFAKHRARVEETIAFDRKQAEKYAKDFARYQKHQADQLAKIMARAEKQREQLLNRVNQYEQRALENFRNRNASSNLKPQQN